MLNISSSRARTALFLLALVLPLSSSLASTTPEAVKKCLYVSSYHQGHSWSDSIEYSIRESLNGTCELREIYMDTKRNKNPEQIFSATNKIIKTIEDWQPDIVITSDDNAAKHLIAPHYKDDKTPFVFCGVNWTVDEYGFPFSNVTGIVEVAPVKNMLEAALVLSNTGRKALYIGASTLSERKNFARIKSEAALLNIEIDAIHTPHIEHWKAALEKSSEYDFMVLGSNAGIEGWSDSEALMAALTRSQKVSVTNHKSMLPYSTLAFTKLASEQGEWAANVAINILNGISPADIPIASNKKWDLWVNELNLQQLDIDPPRNLLRKAKRLHARL